MLANMVQETVSVGGTGNITLGGASPGFNTFSDYFADGPGISYWIADGNDWETGIGHLTTGQTILVRDDILRRSVAGVVTDLPAAMNVSTSATVSVRPSALMQSAGFLTFTPGSIYYDIPDNFGSPPGNITPAANTLYFLSSFLLFPRKIAQLGIDVLTLDAAATNTRAGIYTANPDGSPSALIADTGNIDISTTGRKFVTAASWAVGGPNTILLPAGHYYFAVLTDSAAVAHFRGVNAGGGSTISWGGSVLEGNAQRKGVGLTLTNVIGALPLSITNITDGSPNTPMAFFKQA